MIYRYSTMEENKQAMGCTKKATGGVAGSSQLQVMLLLSASSSCCAVSC